MNKAVYRQDQLYESNRSRSFGPEASEATFLLGGIGTGTVSIGSRGNLRDWEIFNRPAKGLKLPYSFFSIWMKEKGKMPQARVLEARLQPPFNRAMGFEPGAGLPRFTGSSLKGEYPFVWVDLKDPSLPVSVRMEAFTPFIPLNADDSGIPAAIIRYTVTNTSDAPVETSLVGSLGNICGTDGRRNEFGNFKGMNEVVNEYRDEGWVKGIFLKPDDSVDTGDRHYANMALMTTGVNVTAKASWLPVAWFDHLQDFWDDFVEDGRLKAESESNAVLGKLYATKPLKVGSIGAYQTIAPGVSHQFEFALAWYAPNRMKAWEGSVLKYGNEYNGEVIRNYYATQFDSAWHAGSYLLGNIARLEKASRDFHRALFSTTVPSYVLDALSANITVLRSNTCFRLEDGTFAGWEGCFDDVGSCAGSCTHVWNYAQTVAFLFPELEQTMRQVEFNQETDDEGNMSFRTDTVFGYPRRRFLPAVDGQLGTLIRLYRGWKLSGDDELLHSVWAKASQALDFAFSYWDQDGDYVLDSQQHNTYDIEFYGPNSLSNSIFFAALKAGAEMARHVGDDEHAVKYQEALDKGSARMDDMLWGGEYYVQQIDDIDHYRYQYGTGCLADQVLGQLLAHVAGLGYILPKEHVKSAVKAIFKYNFKTDFSDHAHVQRTYVLNDEKGLLLCSWPHGGRPKLPFIYSDEVWTGIEYQVAAHCIYEGLVDEGLTIVKAVRERHDGVKRNPWNEVECGHHYVRSMASWALLTALSGYSYDLGEGHIGFDPKMNQDHFSSFFSTGHCWGVYHQQRNLETGDLERRIDILYGEAKGLSLEDSPPDVPESAVSQGIR